MRILPTSDDLFSIAPVPPGLGRLLLWLSKRFDRHGAGELDLEDAAERLGKSEETVRRGLSRLAELGRIEYVPPFRGRATEVRAAGLAEDVLAAVDFEALDEKRRREERKLDEMVGYTSAPGCRARYLLAAFGDEASGPCLRCDGCRRASVGGAVRPATDAEREVVLVLLQAVEHHDRQYGFRKIAEHLYGSKSQAVAGRLSRGPTYGALHALALSRVEEWLHRAHEAGLLDLVTKSFDGERPVHLVGLSPTGRSALHGGAIPPLRAPSPHAEKRRARGSKRKR